MLGGECVQEVRVDVLGIPVVQSEGLHRVQEEDSSSISLERDLAYHQGCSVWLHFLLEGECLLRVSGGVLTD